MDEQRQALETLFKLLEGKASTGGNVFALNAVFTPNNSHVRGSMESMKVNVNPGVKNKSAPLVCSKVTMDQLAAITVIMYSIANST